MKRKIDFVDEEHDNENEEGGSLDDESKDEEPRIKDVLSNLSYAVSNERASDFLHSMATSRDILFSTPRGQLLRNKRIIPVTNIAELVEYVLLPHNDDVTKPRALNTLLDGLAELGVDKGVIKNKQVLNDLIENERENESKVESSSEREEEEIASASRSETEDTQERDNDTENESEETESNSPERPQPFILKIPVTIVRILMCTGH